MFHALFLYNCQRGGLHSLAAIDGKYVSFAVDKLRAIGQINVAVVMTVAIAHEEGRPCGGKIVVGGCSLELYAPIGLAEELEVNALSGFELFAYGEGDLVHLILKDRKSTRLNSSH